jgi:hypothetical protein
MVSHLLLSILAGLWRVAAASQNSGIALFLLVKRAGKHYLESNNSLSANLKRQR